MRTVCHDLYSLLRRRDGEVVDRHFAVVSEDEAARLLRDAAARGYVTTDDHEAVCVIAAEDRLIREHRLQFKAAA